MKPNQMRHADNLSRLTGFWHGKFFEKGVVRPSKEHVIYERRSTPQ